MSHISNSTNTAYKTVLPQAEECNESQPEIALTRESLNTQKVYQKNSKRGTFQKTVDLEKTLKVIPWNIIAQDFDIEGEPKDWKQWSQHSSFDPYMSRADGTDGLDDGSLGLYFYPVEEEVIGSPTPAAVNELDELNNKPSGLYE